jgi:ribosomal protein L29
MKRDQKAELRGKSIEDLQAQVAAAREKQVRSRIALAVDNQRAGMDKRRTRREIARCLTLIQQKKTSGAQA